MGQRGRKAQATNRKRGGSAALAPATFPRSVAWRIDQDYVQNLDPSSKEWLAQFNDTYYGADFRGVEGWNDDERRRAYRDKNCANRDMMTSAVPVHGTDIPEGVYHLDELLLADDGPLDDPRYKTAREAYRNDPTPANRVRLNQARRR